MAERKRLEKYVAERGGTLVILAGKRFMPLGVSRTTEANGETDPLRNCCRSNRRSIVSRSKGFP